MTEKNKVIRVYDNEESDINKFNLLIAEAEEDGWQVTGYEYYVSPDKSDAFIAYLKKTESKEEPVADEFPEVYKAAAHLDAFTKYWCVDKVYNDELKFKCHRCPFFDNGTCDVKRFARDYAPKFMEFGAMSR